MIPAASSEPPPDHRLAMIARRPPALTVPALTGRAVLDIVVPVYNEQDTLGPCVRRLHAHLSGTFPYPFRITIADNASTDATLVLAETLQASIPEVHVVHLDAKGRGRALHAAWTASDAPILAYTDVDLSTDLNALLPLVAPLLSGHSDLAIGTRFSRGSRVVRGAKRELISRSYNLILRRTLSTKFTDAQCGFKAIRRDVAEQLLPLVQDTGWFFDTELLVLAEKAGLRIHEVPVDWIDDPDSRVDLVSTALADLRGVARLGRALATSSLPLTELHGRLGRGPLSVPGVPQGMPRQLARFTFIGVASTAAYIALFLLLRTATGPQTANVIALLSTAVANTTANRRLTFGQRGRSGVYRAHAQGLIVFALGLALTSGALNMLGVLAIHPPVAVEISVLIGANLTATLFRFLLFRAWVFRITEPTHLPVHLAVVSPWSNA